MECEINNQGFFIPKKLLTVELISKIKADLNVSPYSDFNEYNVKTFKVYKVLSGVGIVIPIYYALDIIDNFNLCYKLNFSKVKDEFTDNYDTNVITLRPGTQEECFNVCIQEFNKPFGGGILNLATAVGKCHGIDTPIIMFDGNIKMVQDIKIGDFLMGDDSTKRQVLSLARGQEELYEIKPIKGQSYIVNKSHILSLKNVISFYENTNKTSYIIKWFELENKMVRSKSFIKTKYTYEQVIEFKNNLIIKYGVVDIELQDYLKLSKSCKHILKGYKVPLNFPEQELPLDPYMIGFWLGDGSSITPKISSQDSKVLFYFREKLRDLNLMLKYNKQYDYYITSNRSPVFNGNCNECNKKLENKYGQYKFCNDYCFRIYDKGIFNKTLQEQNLLCNKHIPDIYKFNSRENRLKLLAGLIDSDGYLNKERNGFEFTQKNEKLMDDVIFLCRSLGFDCYKAIKKTTWTYKGIKKYGTAFRIHINGIGLEEIPTLCDRKKALPRKQKKDVLCYGFKVIPKGIGNYYGFELDGNRRYVLGDFSVTHNTVLSLKLICHSKMKALIIVNTIELMVQWKSEIKKFIPDARIGTIQGKNFDIEDKDITIGMVQTITIKDEVTFHNFFFANLLILDEAHNLNSEVFSKIIFKIRPKFIFGLTATLARKDKLEKLLHWYAGPVLFSNISNEKKDETEIHIYKYKGLSSVTVTLRDNKTPACSTMISNIADDIARSDLIISILKDLTTNKERNVLVISDRISQLQYLHKHLPNSALFIGKMKSDELLKSKESQILLATYKLASEGFSLAKLNCLLFATSRTSITQAIGRIYRKKHEITPIIVDIYDDFSYFKSQYYKRRKTYKELISNCIFKNFTSKKGSAVMLELPESKNNFEVDSD